MNRSGFRLAALGAAGLLLTGCGSEAIDAATAGDLQAEVRTIASTAAAGDPAGAMRLAQDLKVDVENARAAGAVTEERAVLIGMRLDAVITSLEADRAPAGDAPTEQRTAPTEETLEEPIEEPSESQAPAETVSPAEPTPVSPVPAPVQPAPTPDPVQPAPTPTPEEDAEDGEDPWSEDADEEAVQDDQDRAAERAAEQQRKAEEKAREAAEKAAEKAEKAQESGKKGKPDG